MLALVTYDQRWYEDLVEAGALSYGAKYTDMVKEREKIKKNPEDDGSCSPAAASGQLSQQQGRKQT